jgi:NAD(P)-dependent dehydrogenase (short-subunit alcohol dehydrogenase family)
MAGRLADKVAIITGAGCVGPGWGNGRAAAVLFAEEGARVFAADKNADAMTETLARARDVGGEIVPHCCDVTDAAEVAAMVDACRRQFGRIDILVNNVGGSAAGGPVELSEDAWDGQIDSNLKSVFLTCKHTLPVMLRQRSGSIINISSVAAIRYTGYPYIAYYAAKGGVNQFTVGLALEHAKDGIRVNAIAPGNIRTAIVRKSAAGEDRKKLEQFEEAIRAQMRDDRPLKREGTVEDVAEAALYFATDRSRYVTGTVLPVDGGTVAGKVVQRRGNSN